MTERGRFNEVNGGFLKYAQIIQITEQARLIFKYIGGKAIHQFVQSGNIRQESFWASCTFPKAGSEWRRVLHCKISTGFTIRACYALSIDAIIRQKNPTSFEVILAQAGKSTQFWIGKQWRKLASLGARAVALDHRRLRGTCRPLRPLQAGSPARGGGCV